MGQECDATSLFTPSLVLTVQPRRDGQAELTLVAGYNTHRECLPFTRLQTVTHPSTKRAWRRPLSNFVDRYHGVSTNPHRHHSTVVHKYASLQISLIHRQRMQKNDGEKSNTEPETANKIRTEKHKGNLQLNIMFL